MKIPKLKFEKLTKFFKKLPRILGTHTFLTFLGLLVLALIFGSLIFYKYSFLAEKEKPEVFEKPLQFKEKTYQEVLKIWQKREERFEEADFKEYPDPFREIKEKPPVMEEKKIEEEIIPEPISESLSQLKIKELQAATNLDEFYKIKGEKLPLIAERAKIWEEKGLGSASEYWGFYYQNIKLLEELKKELTE